MILADTSAWIEFDRATGSSVDQRVAALIAADNPPVVTETVETHVSNIFRKMNVNSRAELALVVERGRIADRGSD